MDEGNSQQILAEIRETKRLVKKLIRKQRWANIMSGLWWGFIIFSIIFSFMKLSEFLSSFGIQLDQLGGTGGL